MLEIKLPTSVGSSKKQENSRKASTSALLNIPKPLTVWITKNCGKFLKEMGTPDPLTYLRRNLYAGQEATDRIGHGTTDWFQIGFKSRMSSPGYQLAITLMLHSLQSMTTCGTKKLVL